MAKFKIIAHLEANVERSTQDRIVGYLPADANGEIEYVEFDAIKMRQAVAQGFATDSMVPIVKAAGHGNKSIIQVNLRYVRYLEITEEK